MSILDGTPIRSVDFDIRVGIYHAVDISDVRDVLMRATAKIFMHGRSQAVRLPKEFRFSGTELTVTKVGDRVILEPIEASSAPMPWAAIDALGDKPFMPDGRDQPPMPSDRDVFDP